MERVIWLQFTMQEGKTIQHNTCVMYLHNRMQEGDTKTKMLVSTLTPRVMRLHLWSSY